MDLERVPGPEDVATRAADAVARTVAARQDARIVLPAGATPVPVYAELVRRTRDSGLDLSAAHLFQLDELVGVSASDSRSFHSFLKKHLLDRVERLADRDHLLDGAHEAPGQTIERHAAALATLGGADLVLLGLGRNGHVAFNEPGSGAEDGARVVELHDATTKKLEPSFGVEETPRHGLTLGLREILAARDLVLLVTGAAKATVLHRVLDDAAGPDCPASLLVPHRSLTVLADSQALSGSR